MSDAPRDRHGVPLEPLTLDRLNRLAANLYIDRDAPIEIDGEPFYIYELWDGADGRICITRADALADGEEGK